MFVFFLKRACCGREGYREREGKLGGIRHGGWVRIISACMCFVIFSLVFRPVVSRRRLLFGFVIISLSADRTGGVLKGGGGRRAR